MNEKIDTLTDIIVNLWRELGKLSTLAQDQQKEIERLKAIAAAQHTEVS